VAALEYDNQPSPQRQGDCPVREGIEVTAGQLDLVQLALAQPYQLDNVTVARISRVHQDRPTTLVLFQNQADKWNATAGLGRDQPVPLVPQVSLPGAKAWVAVNSSAARR
jgi:hypothetical protein